MAAGETFKLHGIPTVESKLVVEFRHPTHEEFDLEELGLARELLVGYQEAITAGKKTFDEDLRLQRKALAAIKRMVKLMLVAMDLTAIEAHNGSSKSVDPDIRSRFEKLGPGYEFEVIRAGNEYLEAVLPPETAGNS